MQGTSWWMLKAVWRRRKRPEYFSAFVLITDLQLALSVQVSNHRNFCSLSNHHLKSKEGCFKREGFVGRIWQNGFCPSFSPYRKWLLLISISQLICFNRNAGYVSCAPGFAAAPRVPLQMESVSIRAPSHSWEQVLKSTPPRTWKLGGGRRIQTWGKNGLNRRVAMQKKKPNHFKMGILCYMTGLSTPASLRCQTCCGICSLWVRQASPVCAALTRCWHGANNEQELRELQHKVRGAPLPWTAAIQRDFS